MFISKTVPSPRNCVNIDFTDADAALRLIDNLPWDFRVRLIQIAADRCRRSGHILPNALPDVATLRRAIDRPRLPEGWVSANQAMDSVIARGSPWNPTKPSAKLTAWYDREIDGFFDYLRNMEAWEAVASWHPVAREAVSFMQAMTPADGSPAHPSARGVRLMAKPDADLRDEASRMATTHQALQDAMATIIGWEATPDHLREIDPRYWRRVMRRETKIARQYWQAALGVAHAHGAAYCSDYTLLRWRERQQAAAEWAAECDVISPTGDIVAMSEIRDAAQRAHIARLYVNTLCLQELGRRRELVPVFLTLTLPPKFHPRPTSCAFAGRSWTPEYGPMAATTTLQQMWIRFRARLAADGVSLLGLRVVEAHQDGTPHLHAMIWVEPTQIETVKKAVTGVAPGEHQSDIKIMVSADSSQTVSDGKAAASPATYLMKYLIKTTNVSTDDMEAFGVEMDDAADREGYDRVRAQLSELGVRRFALLGLHGVQRIWQRIAIARQDQLAEMPEIAQAARRLMDEARQGRADAEAAVTAMTMINAPAMVDGGDAGLANPTATAERQQAASASVRLWTDALTTIGAVRNSDTAGSRLRGHYEESLNAYGESYRQWKGFFDTGTGEIWIAPTWTIKHRKNDDKGSQASTVTVADRYPSGGDDAPLRPPDSGLPEPPPSHGGGGGGGAPHSLFG